MHWRCARLKRCWPMGLLLAGLVAIVVMRGVAGHGDTVLETTLVGQYPTQVAVDARTSRAFVLNQGSGAQDSTGGIVAGTISVLDTRTGALVRTAPAGTAPQAVAVDERTGRVFVVNSFMHNGGRGTVEVLDAQTGGVLRVVRVGGLSEAVVVDQRARRVFVLNQGPASLSVLDAISGRLLETIPLRSDFGSVPNNYSLADDARQGRLFAFPIDPAGGLRMFDTRQGLLPRALAASQSSGDLVVDEQTGRLFVFSGMSGEVRATATGRLLRRVTLGGNFNFAGAAVDERTERLFVISVTFDRDGYGSNLGQLYVLDGQSGAILHTIPIGWPTGLAVDERSGKVLVTTAGTHDLPCTYICTYTSAGRVLVCDGRSGAVLRTILVGVDPRGVAVDPQTGHALVVNTGGRRRMPRTWTGVATWLRHVLPFLPPPSPSVQTVSGSVSILVLQ